jgi:hypothetical protein
MSPSEDDIRRIAAHGAHALVYLKPKVTQVVLRSTALIMHLEVAALGYVTGYTSCRLDHVCSVAVVLLGERRWGDNGTKQV